MTKAWFPRFLCVALLVVAGAVQAAPMSLRELAEGLDTHPDYALALSEGELADAQLARERAASGARLYGNLGGASAYEPQFGGGTRDYTSLLGSLGVRYPLLAAAGEERIKVGYATIDAMLARVQRETLRQRLLQDLRNDYYAHARAEAQQALAARVLQDAVRIREVLAQRVAARLLLDGERRDLELGLAQAERQQVAAQAEQARAAHALRQWRPDFAGQVAQGPGGPLATPARQDVEDALQALVELQQELAAAGSSSLRANAYVAANARKDSDLGRASGFNAGISFELPLDAAGVARSSQRETTARVQRARLLLQRQDEALRQWHAALVQTQEGALAELRFARSTAVASGAALREAAERARLAAGVAGDPIERWVRARNNHYAALNGLLLAQTRAWAVGVDIADEVSGCAMPDLAWLHWVALQAPPVEACAPTPAATAPRLAVYAWGGQSSLASAAARAALDELGASDIWLSFSAPQLRALAESAARAQLAEQIRAQQRLGRRVGLLLGDPDWLRSAQGASLGKLVRSLADLPFDGLHLDLEPDQLPPAERDADGMALAWRNLAARVAELRTTSRLPITLSIHWRALLPDAAGQCPACAAAQAADEVAVMLYTTSADSARTRILRIAATLPGKPLWLAQSIEPELGPDESHYRAGRAALRRHLQGLQALASQGVLRGTAVQSLETYLSASP